jgi:hypothetical protein
MDNAHDQNKRLTYPERMEKRRYMIEEVDDFIKETILYCDSEEDLIALGSMLQIQSKNILTTCLNKKDWKAVIQKFAADVEKDDRKNVADENYRGYFY